MIFGECIILVYTSDVIDLIAKEIICFFTIVSICTPFQKILFFATFYSIL